MLGGCDRDLIFSLSVATIMAIVAAHLDLFERLNLLSRSYEHVQLDELLLSPMFFAVVWIRLSHRKFRRMQHVLIEREERQQDAMALAYRDPLTGLYNRRSLEEFFCGAAASDAAAGARSVLLCDLDGFKQVNDKHGHRTGDLVLCEIASRLRVIESESEDLIVVRLGGDEFACVFHSPPGSDVAGGLAQRIRDAVSAPIALEHGSIALGIAIGLAEARAGESLEDLLGRADAAMYLVKHSRRRGEAEAPADEPYDPLRPGRRALEREMEGGAEDARGVYVAVLGIDRFRTIQTMFGYGFGGRVLRELVARLRRELPDLAIEQLSSGALGLGFRAVDEEEASRQIAAIRASSKGWTAVDGHPIDVMVSLGYAGPGSLEDLRELVENAQFALEQARSGHVEQAQFSASTPGDADERLMLMREMRAGLQNGEIYLAYQPKVDARSGALTSVEGLIRWHSPRRGSVPPDRFVMIAEETGDIRAMTEWVVERAVQDQARMRAAGFDLRVFVNISARLVGDAEFIRQLLAMIEGSEDRIGLEITETAVLRDPEHALANLRTLADAGVRLAIDDYGRGMSSLAYLKQFPAHELKIDRLFVKGLASSHRDPLIVRSTIELAHGLGMTVTAEGVDTSSAVALLQVMGCDFMQGFIFAPALPLPELIAFCAQRDPAGAANDEGGGMSASAGPSFERLSVYWGSDLGHA